MYIKLYSHLPGANKLTHSGQDKMAAISQTTFSFSNAFSSLKTYELQLKFRWNMFLWVSLGWLYVFSSFPPRPRPPPQKLFPLTSKLFELNHWYLVQRIYGSGKLYWMTFPWPWPKVTAVASISKNLLVCAIKWEPLIGSLQNIAVLLP